MSSAIYVGSAVCGSLHAEAEEPVRVAGRMSGRSVMKIARTLELAQSFSTSVRRSQFVCTGEESPFERFRFLKPVSEFHSTKRLW